jgi:RNA polymerase subunit RPABC4/transcription elongation factor Spt4
MNKSVLVKLISNTKFSSLSEEKLAELYHIINQPEEKKKICPKCNSSKLASFSSLNYKQCTNCQEIISWKLEEKQKPLIQHQR